MGYETINVMLVTPRIGAEVAGLTLARPLSNRQVEAPRAWRSPTPRLAGPIQLARRRGHYGRPELSD
jgi:hypothetical protein